MLQDWLDLHFQSKSRDEIMLYSNDNILTPESIREMYRLWERVQNITVNGKTFADLCETVPIADIFQTKRRRRRDTARQGKILVGPSDDSALSNDTDDTLGGDSDSEGDYEDLYDFWADEYNYDDDGGEIVAKTIKDKPRIDFGKYGARVSGAGGAAARGVAEDLPRNIYCDLVQTLNTKCVQTSLLGKYHPLLSLCHRTILITHNYNM